VIPGTYKARNFQMSDFTFPECPSKLDFTPVKSFFSLLFKAAGH
jgi:hypothetical protein